MNKEFWTEYYAENKILEPSEFAKEVMPFIEGDFVDIGCGDGRDLHYFLKSGLLGSGVDESGRGLGILTMGIDEYMETYEAKDNVYARFFWHAITSKQQLAILDWTKKFIWA